MTSVEGASAPHHHNQMKGTVAPMSHLNKQRLGRFATRVRSGLRIVGMAMGLGLAVWLQASASLASSFVDTEGYVQANDFFDPSNSQSDSFVTHSTTLPSVTGSVSSSIPTATASVDGTATLGSLSGTTSASAVGLPFPSVNPSPVAVAQSMLFWSDVLTVTSPTLAFGTPVDFTLTGSVDAVMTSLGIASNTLAYTVNYSGGGLGAGGSLQHVFNNGIMHGIVAYSDNLCSGACSASSSMVIPVLVGSTLNIQGRLDLGSVAYIPTSSAQIDAAHTARLFIDSLTSGASYFTDSGVTYFSPVATVPEPSTILLLGAGLVGLMAWGRKRTA